MRILFIDDEPDTIASLQDEVHDRFGADTEVVSFGKATETIGSWHPDVIVLDLREGGAEGAAKAPGRDVFEHIWTERFCPIVVYSAVLELLDPPEHPFVVSVPKGKDSELAAAAAIEKFGPHLETLVELQKHIARDTHVAIRNVLQAVFAATERRPLDDTIVRLTRRHLAALMDSQREPDTELAPWEQYIWPPPGEHPLACDVLRAAAGEPNDPTSFRLILTPSCDLVATPTRKPKVGNVLVARCCKVDLLIPSVLKPEERGEERLRNEFERALKEQPLGCIAIPPLPGVFPVMAADLRDLELIPLDHIGAQESERAFHRVASVDSPFREGISWAYLQTTGRPGLPDIDRDVLRDELVKVTRGGGDDEGR